MEIIIRVCANSQTGKKEMEVRMEESGRGVRVYLEAPEVLNLLSAVTNGAKNMGLIQ